METIATAESRHSGSPKPPVDARPGQLLCSYDLRGNLIEVHDALERVLGFSRETLLGRSLQDILEPEVWEIIRQHTVEQLGGPSTQPLELRMRSKSGRQLTIDVVTRLVFEKGTPVAVQAFGSNLSDLRPDALIEVEERHSTTKNQLAHFTEHLKQLHRLSTTNYKSLGQVFSDYLKTGCEVFQLPIGMVLQSDGDSGIVRALYGDVDGLLEGGRLSLSDTHLSSLPERLRTWTHSDLESHDELGGKFEISIATPILVDSELFGTLIFAASDVAELRLFSREQKEIIEMMASSIARFMLEDRVRAERRAAEKLERHRNRVLEMVAENRPLVDILTQLAVLVEDQVPHAVTAMFLSKDGALSLQAGPSLPAGFGEAAAQQKLRILMARDLSAPDVFEFAQRFQLQFSFAAPIFSGTGGILGAVVLLNRVEAAASVDEEVVIRLASRLAGIAIEQRRLTERLEFQAQHDFLTGLPNRFRLLELLEERLRNAQPSSPSEPTSAKLVAVLFIDLDRFKQINDTLGHSVGDRLLIEVGERLRSGLSGEGDFAGRMGGDEFAVIQASPESEDAAIEASRVFLDAFRAPYLIDGRELFVTASIGVSFFPRHGDSASTLLRKADAAMYLAKKDGKNAIQTFVPVSQHSAIERLELENALRRALEKSEFELFFQPIVSMQGELDGLEVLLAWNHATRGKIPAGQFIPMAEETGLIVSIGAWVLQAACAWGARWLAKGLLVKRIAVNVSALQFARANFVDTVAAALSSTGFPPRLLELELTETLVLQDMGESIHRMMQLQELGITMAIDDFGTGYSSLNYLRRLPVDELKIDQSFLRDLRPASGTLTVIQTIVSLAHKMNLSVVAEGVETMDELDLLRAAGCDRVQGHLYGESLKASDAEILLARLDRQVPIILN